MEKSLIEQILKDVNGIQELTAPEDELTKLISQFGEEEGELDQDEMELVTAAGGMSYAQFLKNMKKDIHEF